MKEVPHYIRNHEAVEPAFGYWPSFHDAPVLAYERADDHITFALHGWEMTSEVDAAGYFVLRKHHIVRFAFRGVTRTELPQFATPDILFRLGFSPAAEFDENGWFTVSLDSAMGGDLCGSFAATDGEVSAVVPCDKDANAI